MSTNSPSRGVSSDQTKLQSTAARLNTVMLVLVALILIVMVGLAYQNWRQYSSARQTGIRTQAIRDSVETLLISLGDAESGQRGFLFTGEERYLERYSQSSQAALTDVTQLSRIMTQSPEQTGQIGRLKDLVNQKLSEMNETIDVYQKQGRGAARAIVLTDEGKRLMNEIRDVCSSILGQAESEITVVRARSQSATGGALVVTLVGAILLLLLSAIGSLSLNRMILARERAFREASLARDYLKTTLASIGDGVITTDAEGRIQSANAVAQSTLRAPEAQLAGRSLNDVFRIVNEFTRVAVESPLAKVLREGATVGLANHAVLIAQDGREIPIDDSGAPIRGNDGQIQGAVLVFRDGTARRQAEANAQLVASIIESSEDAIISKDLNGVITTWNPAAERMFGYSADEAIGKPISIISAPGRDEMATILAQIKNGKRVEPYETERQAKSGRVLTISLSVSPVRDAGGRVTGASKIARDITELKRIEQERAEHLARERALASERALREREAQLARVTRALSVSELAASIAHEINQPLAGVVTSAEAGLRWLGNEPPNVEEAKHTLALIARDGNRASAMIQRIRDYLRKEGQPSDALDVNQVIHEALGLAEGELKKRGVPLHAKLAGNLPTVRADRIQLQQVILNLVVNGADATTASGRPGELEVTSRTEDGAVVVAVRDSGIGVKPEDLDRIFDAFFTTKPNGMGMGLSISRSTLESHGGRIWAEANNAGPGLVMQFLLPIEQERQPSAEDRA